MITSHRSSSDKLAPPVPITIPITIELTNSLAWLANEQNRAGILLRVALSNQIETWLQDMGIPLQPKVELRTGQQNHGPQFLDFAVFIRQRRCPYSRHLIARVYESVTRQFPTSNTTRLAHVQSWLNTILAGPGQAPPSEVIQTLDFLSALALAAILGSADKLIGPEVTDAFFAGVREQQQGLSEQLDSLKRDDVEAVLRTLLTFPISLRDHQETIVKWLHHGHEAGWSTGRVAEQLYDLLRPQAIEIHLHPQMLTSLFKVRSKVIAGQCFQRKDLPQESAELFDILYDGLYAELGLHLPDLRCIASDELGVDEFKFRFNHKFTPPRILIRSDQRLVKKSSDELQKQGIEVQQTMINPASGSENSLVSTEYEPMIQAAGLTMWTSRDYSVLSLVNDIRLMAARLLSVEDTQYLLAQLHEVQKAFIMAAVDAGWDAHKLTPVLRRLLRQGISIRNLASIIEALLDFDYITGTRKPYFSEFTPYIAQIDLSSFQFFAESRAVWPEDGRLAAEFVKCSLKREITYKYLRGQDTVICNLLDADIELHLLENLSQSARRSDIAPVETKWLDQSLAAIAKQVFDQPATPLVNPILITSTPGVAILLDELIKEDFPEISVIHRQLLDSSANITIIK